MNNKIIGFCALAICYGCRINKEKSDHLLMDSQSQRRLQVSTAWTQFNSQDSSYRYWYYTGDNNFYFHPDAGLWSRSGQLAYIEQRAVKEQVLATTQHYDSLGIENNRTASQRRVKIAHNPLIAWLWLLLIIPIGGLIYRWRK